VAELGCNLNLNVNSGMIIVPSIIKAITLVDHPNPMAGNICRKKIGYRTPPIELTRLAVADEEAGSVNGKMKLWK
jgi:hypothetical protein